MSDMLTELRQQMNLLRHRLEEAEATVDAIRNGEVDAVLINDASGERVFTLSGAEQPYRLLVEAMQQGAATLATDGTILYCNRSFAALMRKPLEQLTGSNAADLFTATDGVALLDLLAEARITGKDIELTIAHENDVRTSVSASLGELQLQNARALFLVLRDLTEHKQHQELKETDRRKDEFLAMLAHELRNPLAPIASAISALALSDKQQNPVVQTACDIVERQVNQLTRLVDDLLDVSRITRGIITLQKAPLDVGSLLEDAISTVNPLLTARGHRLHARYPQQQLLVNGDYARLSQVLANVLNNAAKYTDDGGDIWLVADPVVDGVRITVRDSGIGLAPDLLPRVFDMFTQAERSIDRSQGGLGIGLTVVKNIIALHGGRIVARSDGPGTGSEFVITLPLLSLAGPHLAAARDVPAAAALPSRRILVVDDNRDAADSMAMLLQHAGQEILIAYDGKTAIEVAEAFKPDLVLLDLGLPGMDGYEVARHLRTACADRKLVLAAVTGYGDALDRQRTRAAGFDHHYVKPLTFNTLNEVLRKIATG